VPSEPIRVNVEMTEDREHLLKCIAPGGKCKCGEPAVVRYFVADQHALFDWPRCGNCPGIRVAQGRRVRPRVMEAHHRALLNLLGDEDAFVAALRLGYRPESYDDNGATRIDGRVDDFRDYLLEIDK